MKYIYLDINDNKLIQSLNNIDEIKKHEYSIYAVLDLK